MAKYVLGEAAARKFKALTNGDGTVGRNRLAGHGLAFDDDFCDPFAVHYAASVRNGEGGFIVWLPTGHELTVDGQNVNVSVGLEAAGGDYPDGWYLLPSEIVPEDQGEFDLYLKIVRAEGAMTTAEFVTEKESGGEYVHVAKVARDQSTGAVSVRQTVRSAVVLGAGGGGGGGNDYFADEESLTLKRDDSTELINYGTIFQIKGFGKHDDPSSATGKSGTYIPASESELTENPSSVAFLGRVGTGESGNQIGYFKLKVKGGGGQGDPVPTCFDYVPTYQQREGEEPVLVGAWIRKNYFYFDGKQVSLGDYQVKSSSASVMLVGLQNAPTERNHNPTWSWSIREGTLPQKPDGGRLVYYFLYSLSNWKIQLDYRTTFLTVPSPHQVAHFEVARPDMVGGGNRVLMCAADDEHAQMDVISKSGYGYLLRTKTLLEIGAANNIEPHVLKYGDTAKGVILADRDITIPQGSDPGPEPPEPTPGTDVTVVTDVKLKMEGGVLKIGLTKVSGKMTSVGTPVTTWTDGITAAETDVVVSADYSTETQSFTITPRKIYTLGAESDQKPVEVFKAIRHS